MTQEQLLFLDTDIDQLAVSAEFKAGCHAMGYHKVKDMAEARWAGMQAREAFSYHWFLEVMKLFDAAGLLHLLQAED